MIYSLFYCSLLLALFPLFGSSNTRSKPHHHSLLTTLSRPAGSSTTCSLPRYYTLLVTLPRTAGSFKSRSLPHHHSLLVTLPRSKIPLNTPCFVTRKIMAEGAKKHDDFRLPT